MKKKSLWIGIGAGVAAVVVAAVWLGYGWLNSPAKKFVAYHQNFIVEKALSWMEHAADEPKTRDFSGTLTVTGQTDDPKLSVLMENVSLRMDVNRQEGSLVAAGDLLLMGKDVLDVTVTHEDGRLGFLLPGVDDNYYVVDTARLRGNRSEDIQRTQLSGKELRALIQAYLDVVYTAVNDRNVKAARDQSVVLDGLEGSFTGTVYTFTPRAGDIESMLVKLAGHLEDNPELRALVLEIPHADVLLQFLHRWFTGSEEALDTEVLSDQMLLDLVAEMRDNAVRLGREVEDSGFTWTLCVEGEAVRRIHLSNKEDSGLIYETLGEDPGQRQEALSAVVKGEGAVTVRRTYAQGSSRQSGSIVLAGEKGDTTLDFDLDTASKSLFGVPYGTYRLTTPDCGLGLEVAPGAEGGVDHILTIDKTDDDGKPSHWTVNINAADDGGSPVPWPTQTPVDVSSLSGEELKDLLGKIGKTLLTNLLTQLLLGQLGL